jgi:hypothetical protein
MKSLLKIYEKIYEKYLTKAREIVNQLEPNDPMTFNTKCFEEVIDPAEVCSNADCKSANSARAISGQAEQSHRIVAERVSLFLVRRVSKP